MIQDKAATGGRTRVQAMRPSRRHRRWLSGWLVALMLFMQWATAAYACPRADAEARGDAVAMAAMPDCNGDMGGLDPAQPQLCKAHCQAGQQSVHSGAVVPDAPPALALAGAVVGVLDIAEAAQLAAAMPPAWAAGPPVGAPPLYLSLHVLRN